MTINFNVTPYFDDYDESKNFHRVLFKPGVAVQARELTQLQTILQKQIERFGRHFFEEGAMVIPGQILVDTDIGYVKMLSSSVSDATAFVGQTVTGGTSGVQAKVIATTPVSGSDPITFFVKYLDSGTTTTSNAFTNGEVLTFDTTSATVASVAATGTGSVASISEGVYFVKGNFVKVSNQTVVLDKYSNAPSYRVGLLIDEQLTTSNDDVTLLDNATGSFNYAAPGADRYKISATLNKLSLSSTLDQDFIELVRVENGEIKSQVKTTDYSVFEKTLARRTFDESGNYTVSKFEIQIREDRDNNKGAWNSGSGYLRGDIVTRTGNTYVAVTSSTNLDPISNPSNWTITTVPAYNLGLFETGNTANLAVGLEPGKAYVQGYEIEKVSTEYLPVPKARTTESTNNVLINANVGNYILVRNLYGPFDVTGLTQVQLRDQFTATPGTAAGSVVGTARIRYVEHHNGTQGTATCEYKFSVFDIQMNAGKSFDFDVKQIFLAGAIGSTADIVPQNIQLSGSITANGTTGFGTGTLFLTELKTGDYITANSSIVRVTAVNNDGNITLGSSLVANATVAFKLFNQLNEAQSDSLIFPQPQRSISVTGDHDYFVSQRYDITPSTGNITITTSDIPVHSTYGITAASGFISSDPNDYVVIDTVSGVVRQVTSVTLPSNQVVLNVGSSSNVHAVYAQVFKTISPKTKTETLATKTFTAVESALSSLDLDKADVYKIDRIIASDGRDLTGWFSLDDGQRPTHYSISKIIRKPGFTSPNASFTVYFRYFVHSNSGDFFSVNSYTNINYEDIPSFDIGGTRYRLSDVIDFRPRIGDAGANYLSTGSSLASLPFRDRGFQNDLTYYLGRRDKIALDPSGRFFRIEGTPSIEPKEPGDPSVGMVLYSLNIGPYTISSDAQSVNIKYIDNKRYTMRDIGRLEKRIENIEYYTSLSLLELETKSLSIVDADGLERFKNGFIVDSFEGHGIGNVLSPDYRCAVDMQKKVLRPFHRAENVKLVTKTLSNIQVTGDVATLPYSHVTFIEQQYASRTENVNPYSVFTFIGAARLSPSTDEWFEIDRRPDIIVNENGNFDTISTIAEASGVTGTVWNSWQTQWFGVGAATNIWEPFAAAGVGIDSFEIIDGPTNRNITENLNGRVTSQSRTGVRTSVVARVDTRTIDDRTLSTAVIPFIRSRAVTFLTTRLKPNTTFYPFFDDVDISAYVQPATRIACSNITGTFDSTTNAGNNADIVARRYNDNPEVGFSFGDVVTFNTGATGVCVHQDENNVYVVNVQGSTAGANAITGSISAATGVVTGVTNYSLGDPLVTTALGDVAGTFFIPNTDAIRFRTGTREFKLTTSSTNGSDFKSIARAPYTARGLLETKQATVAAVRNAEIAREQVNQERTIVERFQEVNWVDPLAQTFLVEQRGGAFLTKIDLYFKEKDDNLPVSIEIREVVNGYPGKLVLPFSRVVKPAAEVNTSEDASIATTFTFPSPVYVQNSVEYCFVVLSDSNEYLVWVAQMGDVEIGGDRLISQQPYAGVMFKSQNASTWTADQTQDIKFKIYRASFTSTSGSIIFRNAINPLRNLSSNPIQVANTKTLFRIIQPNHGFVAGDNVTVSGFVTAGGLYSANVNANLSVSNVLIDSFTVRTSDAANVTGRIGGSAIRATQNYAYDVIQPVLQLQNFSDTDIRVNFEGTPYSQTTPFTGSSIFQVLPNETNMMPEPYVVKGGPNESLRLTVSFRTSNEAVSPVIDLVRTSALAIRNRIDSISNVTANFDEIDNLPIVTANANIFFSGSNTIAANNSAVQDLLKGVDVGKEIVVSGSVSNNVTFFVTAVDSVTGNLTVTPNVIPESSNVVTITQKDNFINEIAPVGGSAAAKYITKQINLQNPSTYLKIMFAASVPTMSDIEVYYKTLPPTSELSMNSINYTLVSPTTAIAKTLNEQQFSDVEYELEGLAEYTSVMVKIVMKSTNSSYVPQVKDLRVISCA